MKKFSLIIPVFNEEKYISDLLLSLAKQSYESFDVTIVNDDSEDRTVEIIENLKPRLPYHTKVIQNPKRLGISKARNKGARQANGKYLVFFDADGKIDPDWLEKANCYLDLNQSLTALGGINLFTRKELSIFKKLFYNIHGILSYIFILFYQIIFRSPNFLSGNNLVIKGKNFLECGGFPDLVAEDVFFTKTLRKDYPKKNSLKLTPSLKVYYSPRRFEKHGYVKTVWEWIKASVLQKRSHKSYRIYR
jgi:glycosyltransferase involved in cell wall biosynthesis